MKALAEAARDVRLVGFDVDGVLTDAGVHLASDGTETKRFDIQDGLGIKLLQQAGLEVVFMSARKSSASEARASELKVPIVQGNGLPKRRAMEQLMAQHALSWQHIAFVGDDLVDIPVLTRCGVAIAPANAVHEVKAIAHHVLTARGGHGAVRECVAWFLGLRGEWESTVAAFVSRAEAPE
jgi:3-deoxy-D-manno-octulosonate 8-phosphate phosphatase (KDO 8-P phosphatase)